MLVSALSTGQDRIGGPFGPMTLVPCWRAEPLAKNPFATLFKELYDLTWVHVKSDAESDYRSSGSPRYEVKMAARVYLAVAQSHASKPLEICHGYRRHSD